MIRTNQYCHSHSLSDDCSCNVTQFCNKSTWKFTFRVFPQWVEHNSCASPSSSSHLTEPLEEVPDSVSDITDPLLIPSCHKQLLPTSLSLPSPRRKAGGEELAFPELHKAQNLWDDQSHKEDLAIFIPVLRPGGQLRDLPKSPLQGERAHHRQKNNMLQKSSLFHWLQREFNGDKTPCTAALGASRACS